MTARLKLPNRRASETFDLSIANRYIEIAEGVVSGTLGTSEAKAATRAVNDAVREYANELKDGGS
jgi:hypothetical protein